MPSSRPDTIPQQHISENVKIRAYQAHMGVPGNQQPSDNQAHFKRPIKQVQQRPISSPQLPGCSAHTCKTTLQVSCNAAHHNMQQHFNVNPAAVARQAVLCPHG